MLIIDTHAHIYAADEKKYPPIQKPLRVPGGKATIEDLQATARANGVRAVCAVQTSTFYRFDNRYICDSAGANRDWVAGICTLDPDNPQSPAMLRDFAAKQNVRGMRSIPARDGRLDHPGVRALWKTASDAGLVINMLIGPEKAAEASTLLAEFPKLRVVLDHCLNLKAGPGMQVVLDQVLRMARHSTLHAKLTFIPTGSATGFPCADMHKPCLAIVNAFGAERCIWGSDFPNSLWTPRVSYAEHLRIFTELLPVATPAREQILGLTAKRLWFPSLA